MKPLAFIAFFTLFISLCCFYIYTICNLYGILANSYVHKIALGISILFPILLITTNLIANTKYFSWNSILYTIVVVIMGFMAYMLTFTILMGILYPFLKTLSTETIYSIFGLFTVLILGISVYGIWNASTPVVTTMTIHSKSLYPLWKDKNIILVSDVHLGLVRGKKFATKVTNMINEQKPDIVLMAGDMIDGPKIPYTAFTEPFKDIISTYGTYYTPGNHEWINVEPEKFIGAMKHVTHALVDEKLIVNGTQIIGINYGRESGEVTQKRLEDIGFDTSIPSIAMLHDPMNNDSLIEKGVDLVVSGHTHCGQFWLFPLLVKKIYGDKIYGVRQLGNQATITSCGIGTAQTPFRNGNHPELVKIIITE